MKPKIAVVRGHYFSKEEMLMFEPLLDEFDITFFVSTGKRNHDDVVLPVVELPCLDKTFDRFSFGAFGKLNGLFNNLTGVDLEYVFGLNDRLRGFDLVYSIDYNYLLTYHLSRIKKRLGFQLTAIHWDNIPFARDRQPLAKWIKDRVYDQIDGFFAMSERAKASLMLEGVDESKIFVTRYGVDTSRFKPDSETERAWRGRYGLSDDDIVILFVGRVRASKGIFELLYAVKKLVTDREVDASKIKLVVVGKGPSDKDVHEMVRRLGLTENVMQIGYISHYQMHNIHNMADIFCLPSIPRKYWQEQLGLVFLEAMACGKPVVSTLSGSIPEVVGDAGILVQPNDHIALHDALKKMVCDGKLRDGFGAKGIDMATKYFSNEKISLNLREAYNRILSLKRSA